MSGRKTQADRSPLVAEYAAASDAFAQASDELQDAIVARMDAAPRNADGTIRIYPAKDAFIGNPQPVLRVTQDVEPAVAAGYLAHVPPPFYLTKADWDDSVLFCDPPFSRPVRPPRAEQPVREEEAFPDPFAAGAAPAVIGDQGPETVVPINPT